MIITLSGGDLGGTQIEWPEGQQEIVLEGLVYRLISDSLAVFAGMAS